MGHGKVGSDGKRGNGNVKMGVGGRTGEGKIGHQVRETGN